MTMVCVDLKPGEGGCQPILDFLTKILPDTRAFEGCQDLKVYVDDDGSNMIFIEYWDSAEAYQRYLSWRTETGVLNELVAMLAEPPVIRVTEDTGV
jgi:quinol monooxygenase YgiN